MRVQHSKAFSFIEIIVSLGLLAMGLLLFTTTLYPLLKQHSRLHEKISLQSALSTLEAHLQSISFEDTQALLKETREIFIYKNESGNTCIATHLSHLQTVVQSKTTSLFPLQKIKIQVLSPPHFPLNPSSAIPLKLVGMTLYKPSDLTKQTGWLASKVFIKNR